MKTAYIPLTPGEIITEDCVQFYGPHNSVAAMQGRDIGAMYDPGEYATVFRPIQIPGPLPVAKEEKPEPAKGAILDAIGKGVPWEFVINQGKKDEQIHKGRFDIDPVRMMSKGYKVRLRSIHEPKPEPAAPWSIGAHVRQHFGRYLADGEQWHRDDFTQEMLEGGWRPVLLDECTVCPADWCRDPGGYWFELETSTSRTNKWHLHCRTKRPLPTIAPAAPVEIPAGYRELADDEKKGQWVEGAKFWSQSLNGWCIARGDGYPDGTPAFPDERIIVPIAAPVETEPENVCRKCGWNPCICPGPRPLIWRDFATDPPQDGDLCPVRLAHIADVAIVELDDGGYYDSIGAPESRYNWQNLFDTPIKHWIALPHLPVEPEKGDDVRAEFERFAQSPEVGMTPGSYDYKREGDSYWDGTVALCWQAFKAGKEAKS